VFARTRFRSLFLPRWVIPLQMNSGSQLAGEGIYELCWASFDWLRGIAFFGRRS
jgi:hypothetical protein